MNNRAEASTSALRASRIADLLTTNGHPIPTSESLHRLCELDWARLAKFAGVRPPSAETRQLVVVLVEQRLALLAVDALAGLHDAA